MNSSVKNTDLADSANIPHRIRSIIRSFHCQIQASSTLGLPPVMAERLANLVAGVPLLSKRSVVLTGLEMMLDICERSPSNFIPELKLGTVKTRGQTSLSLKIPIDLDERLTACVKSIPAVSRRDVMVAGLDLILTRCEIINGKPFQAALPQQPAAPAIDS